jgi:hypothetical protein
MTIKQLLYIILLMGFYKGVAQIDTTFIRRDSNYEDDTLIYRTDSLIANTELNRLPILYGTVVVPETNNTISARIFGLYLSEVSKSSCKRPKGKPESFRFDNEVYSLIKTDSSWLVELKINANCCHEFLCEISVENDSILNFIYKGYGTGYCACRCNYKLTYNILLEDYEFMNEEVAKIKYTMLNGDEQTIREIE